MTKTMPLTEKRSAALREAIFDSIRFVVLEGEDSEDLEDRRAV